MHSKLNRKMQYKKLSLFATACLLLLAACNTEKKQKPEQRHPLIKEFKDVKGGPGSLNSNSIQENSVLKDLDEMEKEKDITAPSFPGGLDALKEFERKNIQYPIGAKELKLEGRVIVRAMVDKQGGLSQFSIIQSSDACFNEEALRIVKSMPRFKPAKKNGRAIEHECKIPVFFKLN